MEKLVISGPDGERLRADIEQLCRNELPSGWVWLQSSRNSKVAHRESPEHLIFKRYLDRSLVEGVKSRLRGDRSERAIVQGAILRENGFHAPIPLCWGQYGGSFPFVVFKGETGMPLGHYVYGNWKAPLSGHEIRQKRVLIDALAAEVARMHRAGIVHGDLRLNNILVLPDSSERRFVYIDNERNSVHRNIPLPQVRKNLVQLGIVSPAVVTDLDRLRFFAVYNQVYGRFTRQQQRSIGRSVWRQTLQRFKDKFYFQDLVT